MRLFLVLGWLLLTPLLLLAQTASTFEATFYFETANHTNYQVDQAALDTILAYSRANPDQPLIVQGHTDDQGDDLSNLQLSKDRALTIQKALIEAGIAPARIQIKALGERFPLYDNDFAIGRQRNRRVEVFITHEVQDVHLSQAIKNKQVLERLRPAPAQFAVKNSTKDTFFVTSAGTRVYVPANAFEVEDGKEVAVSVREAYTFSDMILNGLSTTSNGKLLTTGGMFEVVATSEGQQVDLRQGKTLSIQVPTDSVLPEMQLYDMDTSRTAMNWVNPRPLVRPVGLANNVRTGVWEHRSECLSLSAQLDMAREKTALGLRADSAKQAYKSFKIPSLRYYPTDSISSQLSMHKDKKNRLEGKFDKPCKGFFCKLQKLFEGRKVKQERADNLAEAATMQTTIAELQTKLDKNKALKQANRLEIDSMIMVQRRMRDHYKALQKAVQKEREATAQTAVFEKTPCGQEYKAMPEELRPFADADRHLAVLYYEEAFEQLATNYPQHEALISQHLYQQPTYAAAAKEKRFIQLKNKRNLKGLEQLYPEREEEVCQELYEVPTFAAAKRQKRYWHYLNQRDLERLEAEFPEREEEICRRLYNVATFAQAKQEKRERVFMRYCQNYDLEGLERDFKDREREVCMLLYGVPNFEEATKEKERRDRVDNMFYSLQLKNESLGRWMNLDYLRKLPQEELLVQTVRVKAPLMRQDFLIYRNTKAMAGPSRRSSTQTQYKDVVNREDHTLVSYYAIDDEHVALAVHDFKAARDVEVNLTYERLTLEDFATRLATFN